MSTVNNAPPDRKKVIEALWRRGQLSWLLDANQLELYNLFHESNFKIQTWLLARRCLAKGTLIKTPKGLVAIENLQVGDEVFGYNKDESISICKVKETFYNGPKEVWDLCSGKRILETCTKNHTWLTVNEYDAKLVERETKDIKKYNKIVRKWVDWSNLIGINEPHAYAIGALLGDGCSKQGVNKIYISSETDHIPNKIAKILNAPYVYNNSEINYTWCISNEPHKSVGGDNNKNIKVLCNYYDDWCKDRYAHEKIADLEIIKSWNPESQLAFLAGIIDTDGSFSVTSDNCLMYSIEMQALKVIEACQYIIHNLFQHKSTIYINDREKFVNGPTYSIKIKNNFVCKKMLRALSKYQVIERKKWKPDYEMYLENNSNPSYVGVKVKNPRFVDTYDIHIDNDTNLYLTANGLVTHNSGKSYALCVMAIEQCLRHPGSIVKFLSPSKKQVERNIRPLMSQILETCPEELRPELKVKDDIYYFSNRSEIQMAGSEMGNIDSLRGGASHISIIDEAQDVSNLPYAINSVLLPTTSTTRGKVLLAGTPPSSYDHEFIQYIEKAEIEGSIVKRTVYANPRMDKKEIQIQADAMGGFDSEGFRREFLCEIIKDSTMSVIPEFTNEKALELVREWPRPVFYHPATAMDIGYKDWTFVVFGYYDFRADKLIIEDELITKGTEMYLAKFGDEILKREESLWVEPTTKEIIPVKRRVCDHDLIAINEIKKNTNYKVNFEPADKHDKMAGINFIRNLIKSNKIIINPKCKYLIHHLKNAKWAKNREIFARCAEGSHYDGVPALVYLSRGINYNVNPYPPGFGSDLRISDTFNYKEAIGKENFKTGEIKNEFGNTVGYKNPPVDVYKKILGLGNNKSRREQANELLTNRNTVLKKVYK